MFDLGQAAAEQQRLLQEFDAKLSGAEAAADREMVAEFLAAVFRYEPERAREILHCMEGKVNE